MKKGAMLLGIAVLALLVLLWWLTPTPGSMRITGAAPTGEHTSQYSAEMTTPMPQPDKLEFLRDLAKKANRPISFYGKVIDQKDNPVPGVKVTVAIRTANEPIAGIVSDMFAYLVVTTDMQGRFSITDAKGALLTVKSLEKPGYEASTRTINKSYWYWRDPSQIFTPDSDDPELFRMWKNEGAEKLVLQELMTRIPYDGSAVTFDLLSGRQGATGGDFRVTLIRVPEQIQWGQRNYDWTLSIEAAEGGLIESSDEQMFQAPEEGYLPRVVFHMPRDAADWTDEKAAAFYIKSRGGKLYGRIEISVMVGSDKSTTGFSFRSAVNPTGSRNLEYDPLQNLQPDVRPQAP